MPGVGEACRACQNYRRTCAGCSEDLPLQAFEKYAFRNSRAKRKNGEGASEGGEEQLLKKCAACGDDLPRGAFGKYNSCRARAKCEKCEEGAKGKTKARKRCEVDVPKDACE